MQNDLPVCERHVRGALHGREVPLPLWGVKGRTGELAVNNFEPIARHRVEKHLQPIAGDLMSEAATATVEHHCDLVRYV